MDTSTSSSTSSGELPDPNPNKSYEVVPPPGECISSLCFSPKADYLVATSWDSQVNVWEIQRLGATTKSVARATMEYDLPDLCSTWKDDESTVFSGGCDKVVKMWQLVSGLKPSPVGMHDGPVKEIAWIPDMNLLVTGSWDKTLRYWDLKQKNRLVHRKQLPDRCYALDVKYPLMVVGTADRNLVVFDLRRPQEELKRIQSPLKCQTRCVAVFPDKQGFLVGSTEGRVGVHHLDDSQRAKNLTFKCHREGNQIYSVNSLNFHPVHHTFATAGSDGAFNFWDKDSKRKLKAASRCLNPIPCSAFNSDGSMYAYAVCYDWTVAVPNPSTAESSIYIHLPEESEVKGKPPRAGKDGM